MRAAFTLTFALLAFLAAPASAQELMIANILPTDTVWTIDGVRFMDVPSGQRGFKPLAPGRRDMRLQDNGGRAASRVEIFAEADLATVDQRRFWCAASRLTPQGAAEIIVLDRATCQQLMNGQPPPR